MKTTLATIAVTLSLSASQAVALGCYVESAAERSFRLATDVSSRVIDANLPTHLDYRNVSGYNMVTPARSQFLPKPCGSCWAFATTGALSDRLKLAAGGLLPDFNVAPQILLNSALGAAGGTCDGGSAYTAYSWIQKHGIADETCMPYEGVDHSAWGEVADEDRECRTCDRFGTCSFTTPKLRLNVSA